MEWHKYDRDLLRSLRDVPSGVGLVWIYDEYYAGVTCGDFDGAVWRMWEGSDDCLVNWWAPMEVPNPPSDLEGEEDDK